MKAKAAKLVLSLAGLVILQQGIAFGHNNSALMGRQAALIEQEDIDPAALFYTESPLALKAEKTVRNKIGTALTSVF